MNLPQAIELKIDWHCHLLPGFDDGPANREESIAMARVMADGGIEVAHCTPHFIKGSYEHTPADVRSAVSELQNEISSLDIQLQLRPGMEYMLDEFFPRQLANPLTLGDSDLLLVEAYPSISFEQLKEYVFEIVRVGLKPLLAHPERNVQLAASAKKPGFLSHFTGFNASATTSSPLLAELAAMGCRFQGNLGSLTGYYGRHVQAQASLMFTHNIYDLYGSDAHSLAQCHSMFGS